MAPYIIALLTALLVVLFVLEWRHQRRLSTRVHLMREALRNRDFMFRLPTDSIMPGEREMQKMLNEMGGEINQLMARSEVESWQRLTRVLTHEIMNAVTPIQSITQAYIGSKMVKGTPLEEGIQAIYDTSRSLSAFVESYRKMTQLQTVNLEEIDLQRLVTNLQTLYPNLTWHVDLANVQTLHADASMMHQVLTKCGGGRRAKHRHLRTPHRPVHAAAHQQRRHADSGGGGARGVRAVLHHEAHGVGHRAIALAPDDDGAGRQPRSRRTRTSRIPHHVRRNAVAKGIHMGEHQYFHRMHGNFLKRRVSHRLHGLGGYGILPYPRNH